ncbi:hypothetical protein Misp01_14900 [Microtetraspora sp. NBRC 13810]|uniref:DUF2231 domain-containing protein n=1 Tax=Microtetraspora sp. NBRC 13810 TaxID=3030990 RepID=UPI0024A0AC1C|nr:DUF2231 domain-containing protein [Microtetraspora sp. NBRC 13810]GLW06360.1 hypothetical protein Misp01_14900 [Microtetraspora sp. NBRC 13810]
MFDEILGLPAHALIIHAAVVLTPLAVLLSLAYALVPGWRDRMTWAVVPLAVIAPATVLAARQSGEAMKDRVFGGQPPSGLLGDRVAEHESYATPLLLSSLGLGVAVLVLVFAAARLGRAVAGVLSGLIVVLSLVVGFYVLRAGHTGATAVWGA